LNNNNNNKPPTPSAPLWPLIYGIGIIAFSVFLLVVRGGIRIFLIFMIIGAAMVIFWLYLNTRAQKQSDRRAIAKQPCICLICKHKEAGFCIQQKCACCTTMKDDAIIGHSNNPLQ
jgi:Flp pilus assembly protein TadB